MTTRGALRLAVFTSSGAARASVRRPSSSLGEDEPLQLRERGFQQFLLLRHVLVGIADGRRRGSRTAGVRQALARLHAFEDVVLDLEPRTLVLRLVLGPYHFGGVRELL